MEESEVRKGTVTNNDQDISKKRKRWKKRRFSIDKSSTDLSNIVNIPMVMLWNIVQVKSSKMY